MTRDRRLDSQDLRPARIEFEWRMAGGMADMGRLSGGGETRDGGGLEVRMARWDDGDFVGGPGPRRKRACALMLAARARA